MNHRYLRAYMAGIVAPTLFLLVVLTVFCFARFVYRVPAPIERVIVFPMALIPNLFGVWNMLYVALGPRRRLSIGLHGALLPFVLVPIGFTMGCLLGFLTANRNGLVSFQSVRLSYFHVMFAFPALVAVYYLVWKYIVAFLNELLEGE